MKKYIVFLLIWFFTWYYMIMYQTREGWWLLIGESVWFLLTVLQLLYGKYCIQVQIRADVRVIDKGKDIFAVVSVANTGFLPIPHFHLKLSAGQEAQQSMFPEQSGNTKGRYWSAVKKGRISPRQKREISVTIPAVHAGKVCIFAEQVVLYDFLHLFSIKKTIKHVSESTLQRNPEKLYQKDRIAMASVLVLPQLYPVSLEIPSSLRYFGDESGLYYDEEGSDPSEILEIRSWQPGDRLQKVHWKLTERTGELMVREFSEPIGFAVIFLMDTGYYSEPYLETVLSISMEMCMQKCLHYICWQNPAGVLLRQPVVKEEQIYRFLQIAMEKQECSSGLQEENYQDWFGAGSYHTCLRLNEKLELYKGEECIGQIDSSSPEKSLAELMIEI